MTLPKTYKAAIFKAKGEPLTIENVELKAPGPGEVLVKVRPGSHHLSAIGIDTDPFRLSLQGFAVLMLLFKVVNLATRKFETPSFE